MDPNFKSHQSVHFIYAHLLFIFSSLKNLNLIIFHQKIIALQYCIGFCHISTHHTPLGCPRAQNLSSLHHIPNFPWVSDFAYGNEYVSMILSQFVPLSPSPTVSKSLFSMSTSPLLPCKQVHHLSRFHIYIYALIFNICLSLSDLLHSVQQALGLSTSL